MTHFWSKKESLLYFIKKLKNKTEQQLKQAFHAAFIFYEINNTDQDKIQILKNKKANISTKKSNSADWRPVCKNLDSEIKLWHYSPETLEAYRGWARQLQGVARSKCSQLKIRALKDFSLRTK